MGKIGDYASGAIFAAVGIGAVVFTVFTANDELEPLDTLEPLTAARLSTLKSGQPVLLETRLETTHRLLIKNLIAGCEQHYVTSDDGGDWRHRSDFNQSLYVRYGNSRVALALVSGCPRGTYGRIDDPADDERRWIGYRNGDQITAVGKVSSLNPIAIRVGRHYGGTIEDYRGMLAMVKIIGPVVGLVFFAGGIFVIVRTRRKYAPSRAKMQAHVAPSWVQPANPAQQWPGQPQSPPQHGTGTPPKAPGQPPHQWPGPPRKG
jgi:hypothetical protein